MIKEKKVILLPHMLDGVDRLASLQNHERLLRQEGWETRVIRNELTMAVEIHARKEVPDFAPHPTDEAY